MLYTLVLICVLYWIPGFALKDNNHHTRRTFVFRRWRFLLLVFQRQSSAICGTKRRRFLFFKDGLWYSTWLISKVLFQRRKAKIFLVQIPHHKNNQKTEIRMLNDQERPRGCQKTLVLYANLPAGIPKKNLPCVCYKISIKEFGF